MFCSWYNYRRKYQREHKAWARNFFICECLNFINVVVQIFLTDRFLGYEFSTFGMEVSILNYSYLPFGIKEAIFKHDNKQSVFIRYWGFLAWTKKTELILCQEYFPVLQSVPSTNMEVQERSKILMLCAC